jgi:hypothetical protein
LRPADDAIPDLNEAFFVIVVGDYLIKIAALIGHPALVY